MQTRRYLLFDIDGTLILTGSAGKRALHLALRSALGIDVAPDVPFSGRTDQFILRALLTGCGQVADDHTFTRLREEYRRHLPTTLADDLGCVLPGVQQLLTALSSQPHCDLGILTGNLPESAQAKLAHFGLETFFRYGVYGDHSPDRCHLAEHAVMLLEAEYGSIDRHSIWIIGDTTWDVQCAKAIGANVLACCTGADDAKTLNAAGADYVVENLADPTVFELLCG